MILAVSSVAFSLALFFYGAASALFFADVMRQRPALRSSVPPGKPARHFASGFLAIGATFHTVYVTLASVVAHICPVHSVHFLLSVASLFMSFLYLAARRKFPIDALGLFVTPLSFAFLLGTFLSGSPGPEQRLSPFFIAVHVLSSLVGLALFSLAGCAATLYLMQESRLKRKLASSVLANLPPLDVLDSLIHRFLVAGFPLLTLGIVSGSFWAHRIEAGNADDIMRVIFGYVAWALIAAVLLLRAAAGWRGRRSAYGTIAGFACMSVVLLIYLVRPMLHAAAGG